MLWDTQHPVHFWAGWSLMAACICTTALLGLRHTELKEADLVPDLFHGIRGKKGQWVERLPNGDYTLTCESSEGDGNALMLKTVEARYVEKPMGQDAAHRALVWRVTAPTATHEANGTTDTLDGPLFIQVSDANGAPLGSGKTEKTGPALRRVDEVWIGLAPLVWTQLDKMGKGEYLLPAGWKKEADSRLVVERGPVVWNATGPDLVRTLTADSLDAKGVTAGVLSNVSAVLAGEGALEGGQIWAERVEVAGTTLRFLAPLKFVHRQGWQGTAEEGTAIRANEPGSQGVLELRGFNAHGVLTQADASEGHRSPPNVNVHQVRANGTRWTSTGLQLEGNVVWDLGVAEKNGGTTRYLLRAPRAFYRSAPELPGDELPKNIALDSIRAEGSPVLAWNGNSLNSPTMTYHTVKRAWHMESPVYGTVPGGSFSAGSAAGSASSWAFNGAIRADYKAWGTLRGDSLVWDETPEPTYTFMGNPAVLTGLDRRFSGEKIVHSNNQLQFPSGIRGSFNYQGETFTLRAANAEITGNSPAAGRTGASIKEVLLTGSVECLAQSYRFSSKEAVIFFDGNQLKRITAKGGTSLQGSLGSGFGDVLELTFEQGKSQPLVTWSGQVRGEVEVSLGK
jgi:hypothetical protein